MDKICVIVGFYRNRSETSPRIHCTKPRISHGCKEGHMPDCSKWLGALMHLERSPWKAWCSSHGKPCGNPWIALYRLHHECLKECFFKPRKTLWKSMNCPISPSSWVRKEVLLFLPFLPLFHRWQAEHASHSSTSVQGNMRRQRNISSPHKKMKAYWVCW